MFKSRKKLKEKIEVLEIKNNKLQQEIYSLQRNREINYDLYNMVKAILKTLGLNEVEIDNKIINEVKRLEIYTENSLLKNAQRIKLIDNSNIQKIDEF